MASKRSSSSSLMVSMTILALGAASFMARAASMPLTFGIRMSMSTMSGRASPARVTASAPSLAWPTSSRSGSSSRTDASPRRNSAWSSAIRTRIGSGALPLGCSPSGAPEPSLTLFPPTYVGQPGTGCSSPSPAQPARRSFPWVFPSQAIVRKSGAPRVSGGADPQRYRVRSLRGVFHQSNHPVVITPPPVDHAELVTVPVVEQEEIVPHQFHLQQRLVDGHGVGVVQLLPHHHRAVALHLDGHQVRGGGLLPVRAVLGRGRAVAVLGRDRGGARQRVHRADRGGWGGSSHGGGAIRDRAGPHQLAVTVALAAVAGAAEPVL